MLDHNRFYLQTFYNAFHYTYVYDLLIASLFRLSLIFYVYLLYMYGNRNADSTKYFSG